MKRRKFIYNSALSLGGLTTTITMGSILNSLSEKTAVMPVLFMGHGSPMNAVEDNNYTKAWGNITKDIPTPKAILIISAHWETQRETKIYAGTKPKMIYDMYGFPKNLYEVNYSSPGSPELAAQISKTIKHTSIAPTHDWGLDHGAWSVLVKMYPEATIPCFQMSLNNTRDLQWHYELGKELSFLRERGVLIVGSGNIVHNLSYMHEFYNPAPDWALTFDQHVADCIASGDYQQLVDYKKFGKAATISVNSAEHYIPMLYTLALQRKNETISYFNESKSGSLLDVSMRCIKVG